MKKIVLLTALSASPLIINADLLNGPYSPESQKLADFIKNPDREIPQEFKEKASEISILRQVYAEKLMKDEDAQEYVLLLQKSQKAVEAIIQAYKNSPDYLSHVASVALFANNIDLYVAVIKLMSERHRKISLDNELRAFVVSSVDILNDDTTSKKVKADFTKGYEFSKKVLTLFSTVCNGPHFLDKK